MHVCEVTAHTVVVVVLGLEAAMTSLVDFSQVGERWYHLSGRFLWRYLYLNLPVLDMNSSTSLLMLILADLSSSSVTLLSRVMTSMCLWFRSVHRVRLMVMFSLSLSRTSGKTLDSVQLSQ